MDYRQSLLQLVKSLPQPCVMAEIGVHQAKTAAYLLGRVPTLQMYCVDNWLPYKEATQEQQEYYMAAAKSRLWEVGRNQIVYTSSLDAVRMVPDCDIVFVDADHSEEACYADLNAWWPKATRVLCAHDYGKDDIPGVTLAVDRFAQDISIAPIIRDGHIAVFWKPQ